jgi:two-component system response regulator YesN
MIKLLIVDDEPLVQVGIKSMLNWKDLGIEVCGTAMNGKQAYDLIKQFSPEIVITDIKMPIMDGLELINRTKEELGKLPLFIILTSYEEFPLIKEAIGYGVVDYLVKLELTSESLLESVKKAMQLLHDYQKIKPESSSSNVVMHPFHEKFFISLLHNIFISEEEFHLQAKDLGISFQATNYAVSLCTIFHEKVATMSPDSQMDLYFSTIQMVENIISKHLPCYVTSLDMKHFCVIFCLEDTDIETCRRKIKDSLTSAFQMVHNYFNVVNTASVGKIYSEPLLIADSYQNARQINSYLTPEKKVLLFDDMQDKSEQISNNVFNLSLFKDSIRKAFEEYDANALSETIHEILDLFHLNPTKYLQALDAACNILYLSISLLPNGEETVTQIFSSSPDGYHSIYRQTTMDQILNWLEQLCDQLCEILRSQHKTYKTELISNIMNYINDHIEEKLTLNEIASVFGITPNYLSLLFKKYSNMGFSEYITQRKISCAKVMMASNDLKIYEIADRLGFENGFYFSKVFKKVEGCSPREYMQSNQNQNN